MKVLLVNGSPHVNGCTATALAEVEKTLHECGVDTHVFWIGARPMAGCMACGQCSSTGKCVFTDQVNQFTAMAKDYDAFIFGSPVYYASPNGALLSFMDRAFFSAEKVFMGKPAAAVVSSRRAGSTASIDVINKYFSQCHMPIVSSSYWNEVHGNTVEQVLHDEEGMQAMRELGRNMAWLLNSIVAGVAAGVGAPEHEQRIYTNFIK